MDAFPILLGSLCVYALAYRYYSACIAAKAMMPNDCRIAPGGARLSFCLSEADAAASASTSGERL
jgi:hypothetical protein